MQLFKKIFKIITRLVAFLIVCLIILFYWFSTPKSDIKISKEFSNAGSTVFISHPHFKQFEYRILASQKVIDTVLPTIVFVHGSIGSALDFKKYLTDTDLKRKANLIAYDRIGYGIFQTGNVQASIGFETDMLTDLIKKLNLHKLILVGYSYGGPIVLAYKNPIEKIVLLAPEVYAEVEPMPWAVHLYEWKLTRWLLPKIWQAASKEKLTHREDLENFEKHWTDNPNQIVCIQGNDDWIVPYENSIFLQKIFPPKQFKLVTLNGVGHALVWTRFTDIKKELLNQLN